MDVNSSLVLAVNAGSSSLKVSIIAPETHDRVLTVLAEQLNTPASRIHLRFKDQPTEKLLNIADMDHGEALSNVVNAIRDFDDKLLAQIVGIGHRVVHGGTKFAESTLIDDSALQGIEDVSHLAPLHNPYNLSCIKLCMDILPDVPSVAVFDTSFHSTIQEKVYTYPLPKEYRALQMRKFGFHGTSVRYVSEKAQGVLEGLNPEKSEFEIIVCHIGSGASVTAVSALKSRDTSMGFTPLAGLMMGTRCGDVDASLVSFACHKLDKTVDEVLNDFNKNSGLKGMMEGGDFDMRSLLERQHSDEKAKLAVEMFIHHLAQHIASAMVALDGDALDALVFTAGIGEHSAEIRMRTLHALRTVIPSAVLDNERNASDGANSNGVISKPNTWPVILDIATDEEAMIVQECCRLIAKKGDS